MRCPQSPLLQPGQPQALSLVFRSCLSAFPELYPTSLAHYSSSIGLFLQHCQTWAPFSPFPQADIILICTAPHIQRGSAVRSLYLCSTYSCLDHYYLLWLHQEPGVPKHSSMVLRAGETEQRNQPGPKTSADEIKTTLVKTPDSFLASLLPWQLPFLLTLLQSCTSGYFTR